MDKMGCRYSRDVIILPSMCDGDSRLSIPAAFDMFQDTATLHADYFDIGPDGMNRRNYFWIITKTILDFRRLPKMMERVTAKTWIQAADRAKCERDFAVVSGDETLIEGRSIWAVMSHDTGRIVPMAGLYPDDIDFDEPAPDLSFSKIGKDFSEALQTGEYSIRSVDLDLGGHMNNVNYIRAMLGGLTSDAVRELGISRIEVQYISQGYEGETLKFLCREESGKSDKDEDCGSEASVLDFGAVKNDGKPSFLARITYTGQNTLRSK